MEYHSMPANKFTKHNPKKFNKHFHLSQTYMTIENMK